MTVVRRYVSSSEDGKDILQESFISIYKSLHSFDVTKGTFYTWMRTITARQAISFLSKNKVLTISSEDLTNDYSIAIEPSIFDKLNEEEILNIINQIPDDYRVVFNLYYFEDLSHKEIGKLLNIKESSSRSKLTRARKLIISVMENLKFEFPKYAI